MKARSAREAKSSFGLMIDTAGAEPVLIEKHGRGVVMVIVVEEYERLQGGASAAPRQSDGTDSKRIGNGRRTERA
jgi:prevent-host-death family protein